MKRNPLVCIALALFGCGDTNNARDVVDARTDALDDAVDAAPDSGEDATPDVPDVPPQGCRIEGTAPPFVTDLGCDADFEALASEPLDASIPAARSLKTVYDRVGEKLYFQNVHLYPTHYPFCRDFLSGNGLPPVPDVGTFNAREYYSPSRRFLLGSVTHYAGSDGGAGVWAYELAPYDTANATMIETAFRAVAAHAHFGDRLRFHPTSQAIERVALAPDIARVTTEELFRGIAYQPLNLATAQGKLRFVRAADLATTALDFRDILVLDFVPNDISVVQGIITEQLQTPLAHINVLSQNRGTPNMGLVGAWTNATLRALEGRWVALTVGAFDWSAHEVTQAQADAWWAANRPPPLGIPARDLSVTDIRAISEVLGPLSGTGSDRGLGDALDAAIPAFGGKASHYSALTRIEAIRIERALAVPIHWYTKHITDAGLDDDLAAMLADPAFRGDLTVRKARLEALQAAIIAAPIDPAFLADITARLSDLPRRRVRFRSSTNAEDLAGFTGAGLYTSETGDPDDPDAPVDLAIKTVWASVWRHKAFDEREYRGIDHLAVGMALLVSPSFPNEEANGVAITGNLFDPSGIEPAFIVNVQRGDTSVVLPPRGVTSDYFIYYYFYPGQPATYLSHSNLIGAGATVLTNAQTFELGKALDAIHGFFAATYRPSDGGFYGMDVEFKLDGPVGEPPVIWMKQARPHPGWGLTAPTP